MDGKCQTATTSQCESGGTKHDTGIIGDLGGTCGVDYGGCYIKQRDGT